MEETPFWSKFWAQGPSSLGQNSAGPPDHSPGSAPGVGIFNLTMDIFESWGRKLIPSSAQSTSMPRFSASEIWSKSYWVEKHNQIQKTHQKTSFCFHSCRYLTLLKDLQKTRFVLLLISLAWSKFRPSTLKSSHKTLMLTWHETTELVAPSQQDLSSFGPLASQNSTSLSHSQPPSRQDQQKQVKQVCAAKTAFSMLCFLFGSNNDFVCLCGTWMNSEEFGKKKIVWEGRKERALK